MTAPAPVSAAQLIAFVVTALLPLGCVSSSTWSRWHATRDRIEALEEEDIEVSVGDDSSDAVASDDPSSFGTCDEAVRAVIAASPGLVAPRERARAALATARAEGALPAPSASIAAWDFPIGDPSLADREGMYMLTVAQELPPPGSLDASANAAVEEARAALGELDEMRRMVAADAAHDCADWAGAAALVQALQTWIETLRVMRDAVIARYSAAGGALADVARVDREIATAERMIARALGDGERAEEALRARLDVPTDADLGLPPALLSDVPSLDTAAALAFALEHRGVLAAADASIAAAQARADAASARADVPTFMFGAMYMQTPQMRAGLGLEVGMTLPWLWSGERDEAEAARAEASAMEAEAAGLERSISVEVRTALAALTTIRRALAALRDLEAPATLLALDATAATYGAGEGTLLEWLDAARAIRELEIEEVELLVEVAHALADVGSALGALPSDLATSPLATDD